jgi:hypothetical protein
MTVTTLGIVRVSDSVLVEVIRPREETPFVKVVVEVYISLEVHTSQRETVGHAVCRGASSCKTGEA